MAEGVWLSVTNPFLFGLLQTHVSFLGWLDLFLFLLFCLPSCLLFALPLVEFRQSGEQQHKNRSNPSNAQTTAHHPLFGSQVDFLFLSSSLFLSLSSPRSSPLFLFSGFLPSRVRRQRHRCNTTQRRPLSQFAKEEKKVCLGQCFTSIRQCFGGKLNPPPPQTVAFAIL